MLDDAKHIFKSFESPIKAISSLVYISVSYWSKNLLNTSSTYISCEIKNKTSKHKLESEYRYIYDNILNMISKAIEKRTYSDEEDETSI